MSFVAVAWLAIELAPQPTVGLWVGGVDLPGVVGALVFGRRLRRVPASRLPLADSVVRGVFLGAIPLAWGSGMTPSTCRRRPARAAAGMPSWVAKRVTKPIRNREAPVIEPDLA